MSSEININLNLNSINQPRLPEHPPATKKPCHGNDLCLEFTSEKTESLSIMVKNIPTYTRSTEPPATYHSSPSFFPQPNTVKSISSYAAPKEITQNVNQAGQRVLHPPTKPTSSRPKPYTPQPKPNNGLSLIHHARPSLSCPPTPCKFQSEPVKHVPKAKYKAYFDRAKNNITVEDITQAGIKLQDMQLVKKLPRGDLHHVWELKAKEGVFVIKTLKLVHPNKTHYSTEEIYSTIDKTLKGYMTYKGEDHNLRMVKMLNEETCEKDGFYIYEYIKGRKPSFADMKEYLLALVQDPIKHYIDDFKPDNVILPEDGGKAVIIDPSYFFAIDDYKKMPQETVYEAISSNEDFLKELAYNISWTLTQWIQNPNEKEKFIEQCDSLPFKISGAKDFWIFLRPYLTKKQEEKTDLTA